MHKNQLILHLSIILLVLLARCHANVENVEKERKISKVSNDVEHKVNYFK